MQVDELKVPGAWSFTPRQFPDPRGVFLEWFKAPRVYPARLKAFKKALKHANVGVASLLPMYRWASNDEVERQAAVRHWKRAIEIAVELGVDFSETWSCYKGHEIHCGVCGTCVERREAFILAGLPDPTQYDQTPDLPTLS